MKKHRTNEQEKDVRLKDGNWANGNKFVCVSVCAVLKNECSNNSCINSIFSHGILKRANNVYSWVIHAYIGMKVDLAQHIDGPVDWRPQRRLFSSPSTSYFILTTTMTKSRVTFLCVIFEVFSLPPMLHRLYGILFDWVDFFCQRNFYTHFYWSSFYKQIQSNKWTLMV